MKYIKISNKGLLDIRLVSLMGGTTKREDQTKIGHFGSGLKYAMAYLIRNKVSFKIFIDNKEVIIDTKQEEIQGHIFNILYIDGERSSITAQMGYDWTPWMIIREIWCNAIDEGEARRTIESIDDIGFGNELSIKRTVFYIEYTLEFSKVWANWSNYFIQDFEPLWSNSNYGIYPGTDKLKLYKKGVLIYEHPTKISIFNYDLATAPINELREFKGSIDSSIGYALSYLNDKSIITNFLESLTKDHYEFDIPDYYYVNTIINDSWKDAIGNAKIIHQEALEKIKTKEPTKDWSHLLLVPKELYKVLTKKFEGIGALRMINKLNEFYEIFDQELDLKLKQSQAILESCGYFINPELQYKFGDFGDSDILAKIHIDEKVIYISQRMADVSIFKFVAMLIEENEHFRTGFSDETRSFQQHFIDLYTKTLLDKNEVKL